MVFKLVSGYLMRTASILGCQAIMQGCSNYVILHKTKSII